MVLYDLVFKMIQDDNNYLLFYLAYFFILWPLLDHLSKYLWIVFLCFWLVQYSFILYALNFFYSSQTTFLLNFYPYERGHFETYVLLEMTNEVCGS